MRPVSRRSLPENVPHVEPRPSLHQQPDHLFMSRSSRLMQWCAVRMPANRVIPVRILASVQQQSSYAGVPMDGCQGERKMTIPGVGTRKLAACIFSPPQSRRRRQIDPCPVTE